MRKTIKKNPSLKKLHDKAWKLMSIYIRSNKADWRGYVACYTCGKTDHWRAFHCGHWIHNRLDFDPRNLKPQCPGCNTYRNGRLEVYTLKLIDELGLEATKKLRQEAAQHKGYSRKEILDVIEQYKSYAKA